METSGYLDKIKMTYADAQKIVASVVEGRIRWGRLYDAGAIPTHTLCDALVVLAHADNNSEVELRKELAASNRRYAALNARHERLKKKHGVTHEEDGDDGV